MDPENVNKLLDFESSNKTDAILFRKNRGLDVRIQHFIKQNYRSKPEYEGNLLKMVRDASGNQELEKRDSLYKTARVYMVRLDNESEYHNFKDPEIREIVRLGPTMKPSAIMALMFPDIDVYLRNFMAATSAQLLTAIGVSFEGADTDTTLSDNVNEDGERAYTAPKDDDVIIRKINQADPGADFVKTRIDASQRKCIRFLKANLGQLKFILTINSFVQSIERQLFENEFIRATYDKPDMIPDDVNKCMMLCREYVREMQIGEIVNMLDNQMKLSLQGEVKGLNQGLAENLKAKTGELAKCQANISRLQGDLNSSRSKRKETEAKFHESIAKYVNAICDENKRAALINRQKAYNDKVLKAELNKIAGAEQTIGEVHGISMDEILGFSHQILN